jgi:hypothetical protein
MLEVTCGVPDADRRERFAQYVYHGVLGAGSRSTQDVLDLGESLFYEVKVRRLGG